MPSSTQRCISPELTHFIGKGRETEEQYKILLEILRTGFLSHYPHSLRVSGNLFVNPEAKLSKNEMYSPQVVCFCDIPVEDMYIHIKKYSPFGISFDKDFIVRNGGAPVLYVPYHTKVENEWLLPPEILEQASNSDELQELTKDFNKAQYFEWMIKVFHRHFDEIENRMQEEKVEPGLSREFRDLLELQRFLNFHIFGYLLFFDHNLPDDHPENLYFEREWRKIGNLKFTLDDIVRIVLPKGYAKRFREDQPSYYGQVSFTD